MTVWRTGPALRLIGASAGPGSRIYAVRGENRYATMEEGDAMVRRGRACVLLAALVAAGLGGCCAAYVGRVGEENAAASLIGGDLSAWRAPTGEWVLAGEVTTDPKDEKKLAWKPGTGVVVNGEAGRTNHLVSKTEHGDVEVHIEFVVPKGSNSGVYLQGRYEIQVLDSWGVQEPQYSDCGGIYQRWKDDKGYEGHPPRVNASRPPGEWQSFDIVFRAPRFDDKGNKIENARFVKVVHNGQVVQENVELTGPTRASLYEDEAPLGPLMLQGDHGPVAYRNVTLKKCCLD